VLGKEEILADFFDSRDREVLNPLQFLSIKQIRQDLVHPLKPNP